MMSQCVFCKQWVRHEALAPGSETGVCCERCVTRCFEVQERERERAEEQWRIIRRLSA